MFGLLTQNKPFALHSEPDHVVQAMRYEPGNATRYDVLAVKLAATSRSAPTEWVISLPNFNKSFTVNSDMRLHPGYLEGKIELREADCRAICKAVHLLTGIAIDNDP